MQVGLIAHPFFVNHQAAIETVETVGRGNGMRLIAGKEVGVDVARGRGRLESAVTPAAVEVEPQAVLVT